MTCRMLIRRGTEIVAVGSTSFTCVSPEVYQRLRGGRALVGDMRPIPLTAPTAPQTVGRMSPMDVVLSPVNEPDCWQLRVDTRHPVLFDHPVDHVPGMLLMEAARQAWAATHGSPMPLGFTGAFQRYIELDAPCTIRTATIGDDSLLVTGWQNGEPAFTATVTRAPHSS